MSIPRFMEENRIKFVSILFSFPAAIFIKTVYLYSFRTNLLKENEQIRICTFLPPSYKTKSLDTPIKNINLYFLETNLLKEKGPTVRSMSFSFPTVIQKVKTFAFKAFIYSLWEHI